MSSRPDFSLPTSATNRDANACAERMEDYLDHLCAPLIGLMPYQERQQFRMEAAAHLDALTGEYRRLGLSRVEAMEAALREFGKPWQVGQAFLESWKDSRGQSWMVRLLGIARVRALGFFGLASMISLLLLEAYVHGAFPVDGLPGLYLFVALAPLIAGCLTGATMSPRAVRGVFHILLFLIFDSALTALTNGSSLEIGVFALIQLVFWLPIGSLATGLTVAIVQAGQKRRFRHLVRG